MELVAKPAHQQQAHNPFRPGGELSREASEIVDAIRSGKDLCYIDRCGHNTVKIIDCSSLWTCLQLKIEFLREKGNWNKSNIESK